MDILEYDKLVYSIASKFDGYKFKEDLYQAGYMGLVMALKNYNGKTKFSTYAYKYIYGEMCKLVREDKLIKTSRSISKLKKSIDNASSYLSQKLGRNPTNTELSIFLEIDISLIEEAKRLTNYYLSLDSCINNDNDLSLMDVIASNDIDMDTLVSLKAALNNLDQESLNILNYSFNMTESEIAKLYNTNQVKISRTLKKIKENIKSNM